jgi:ADP-ribosylglycohydrolase
MQALERARGALYGLAIGDALGMPAQMLSRAEVVARWGPLLPGFEAAPPGHPIADGMPAGSVTDDTEQAVLLGRLLVRGHGEIDPREWADALAGWEKEMAARGSLDLLGPSTKRALLAVQAGTPPQEAGRHGDTNGAAMRITPVGIAFPGRAEVLDHVRQASVVTHNTPVAMAGAAAVAAAVSAGINGTDLPAAIDAAISAAGAHDGGVAARIAWAVAQARNRTRQGVADFITGRVGTSLATTESVPAAFAVLSAVPDDPWRACLLAASLGGDADTIAAMSGAVSGACHGLHAFPRHAISTVDAHGLGLTDLADALYALRRP